MPGSAGNSSLSGARQHCLAMLRVVLVVLIVLLGADVIFSEGRYTQTSAAVVTAIWRSMVR
jgi:hypothetical protein